MTILVVADFEEGSLKASTASAVAAASLAGAPVTLLVAGHGAEGAAPEASKLHGVERVLAVETPEHPSPETIAAQVLANCGGCSHIFFAMSFLNRAAMPRVAAKLGVSPLSEVSAVLGPRTFRRAIYAGGVITTVQCPEGAVVVATVRTTSFEPAAADGAAAVAPGAAAPAFEGSVFVSSDVKKSDRPELLTAKRVVAGGQGLEDAAGFQALDQLAAKLGAAVGATRVAVDAGLAPNEWQVGQTGKIVAPDLYMAFGISGALQHLAGMMGSKVIVAVNKDPEAPIFEVCDYGLAADAKESIAELLKAL